MVRKHCILVVAWSAMAAAPLAAQDSPAARTNATELSRAWASIGQGDYARAEQLATALLRTNPVDHGAIAVGVSAIAGSGRSLAALDLYEQWFGRSGHEDAFLLQPVAGATLVELGASPDVGLAVEALSKLAHADPDAARVALGKRPESDIAFDGVRASLGNTAARQRLVERLLVENSRDRLVALQIASGVDTLPPMAVLPLLGDTAPPVRAAAIEALARLQGRAAIEVLRPLISDSDPFVQATAAVALARLGDATGLAVVTQMADSPVGDTAAMAAAVLKEKGADVSAIAERVLADANPLTRLSAVPLLADDPARAQILLTQAAGDSNPVIRGRAGQLLSQMGHDVGTVRRLLRDANPEVRVAAAAGLLEGVRPR